MLALDSWTANADLDDEVVAHINEELMQNANEPIAHLKARFASRFDAFDREDGTAGPDEMAQIFRVEPAVGQKILVAYFGGKESVTKDEFLTAIHSMYKGKAVRKIKRILSLQADGDVEEGEGVVQTSITSESSAISISPEKDKETAVWLGNLFLSTLKRLENGHIPYEMETIVQQKSMLGEMMYRAYLNRLDIFWTTLLTAVTLFCFLYRFFDYYYDRPYAYDVFGICICFARGAALAINWLMILVLISVARSFWTWVRSIKHGVVLRVLPIDSLIYLHKVAGVSILFFALIHFGAHICDFQRVGEATPEQLSLAFNRNITSPVSTSYMWTRSIPGTTGLTMIAIFAVAYPFTTRPFRRGKYFKLFWITHHLLLIFSILLVVHGTGEYLERFASIFFVVIPLVLYLMDRIYRIYGGLSSSTKAPIVSLTLVAPRVICLECQKPVGMSRISYNKWNHFTPGGYAFVNVPAIASSEWHPFSLTSAPQDKTVTFHIQAVGDWTNALKELVKSPPSHVYLDGPFGAPSQRYLRYNVAVFVAGGIGVTPYASILSSLKDSSKRFNLKKVILVWIVRSVDDLDWMKRLLTSVTAECNELVEIVHFVTDKNLDHRIEGEGSVVTIYGKRPQIDYVLYSAMAAAQQFQNECGVFFTGNEALGDQVKASCVRLSRNSKKATGAHFEFKFLREVF